jgi:hypothetical protein
VISLRSSIISRASDSFEGVFFETVRDGVEKFGRDASGFEARDLEGPGVAGVCSEGALVAAGCSPLWADGVRVVAKVEAAITRKAAGAGVCTSGGSEDGGSSPMVGFNGVRKGDLKGFLSVFVASFNRRRFACGVDIFAAVGALGNVKVAAGRVVRVMVW